MDAKAPDLAQVGGLVAEAAQEIFDVCGAPGDFCIQTVGSFSVVFGGTNRVIWNAKQGFRPDRAYCTNRFLHEFDAHYGR